MSVKVKTHILIVVLIIFAMAFAARFAGRFISNEPPAHHPEVLDQTQYITLVSASWGYNCHDKAVMMTAGEQIGVVADDNSGIGRYVVAENNAFSIYQQRCGNKPSCSVIATLMDVGFDPAPGCNKELTLQYRCFSYDTLRTKRVGYRQSATIDCQSAGAK